MKEQISYLQLYSTIHTQGHYKLDNEFYNKMFEPMLTHKELGKAWKLIHHKTQIFSQNAKNISYFTLNYAMAQQHLLALQNGCEL